MVLGSQEPGRVGRRRFFFSFSSQPQMRDITKFLRANPQVFVLLVICVVLGLGTFLAVIFGLLSFGSTKTSGEPSGLITDLIGLAAVAPAGVAGG